MDAVFDSVSVATTFRATLAKAGVIFCPISEAVRDHPELVQQYLGSVVPTGDNFFAALNSAVFTDGSFCLRAEGRALPDGAVHLFPHQCAQHRPVRAHADHRRGRRACVSYLEGCTAPMRDENQLHAAVVELVAHGRCADQVLARCRTGTRATRKAAAASTTSSPSAAPAAGARSKISWTQVETGSAITWKYPSCVLQGEDSVGEFYSVAVTNNRQQADTGTKMIHIGTQHAQHDRLEGHQRRAVEQHLSRPGAGAAEGGGRAQPHAVRFSLLIGDQCGAHTVPYIESRNPTAKVEHEATTSKIADDQLFYCRQRGLSEEDAVNLIVNGFCKEVLKELPMEFAVEAQKLLAVSLEGSVG